VDIATAVRSVFAKRWVRRTVGVLLGLALLYWAVPLPSPLFPDAYSTVVLDRRGSLLRAFLNADQQWHFPPDPASPLPDKLRTCILEYEDRTFPYHPGVNPAALARALWTNIASGSVRSGASTITMQVIRLATGNRRTLWNKALEILQAVKLETKYSKEAIFRFYVDHAPYGGNVIGFRAASLRYFGKWPERLTWGEAATLAVLPNSPGLVSPVMNRGDLVRKRNRLLRRLEARGRIDAQTRRLATQEPVPARTVAFFVRAPHFARASRSRLNRRSGRILTTIDGELQAQVARLLARHLDHLRTQGVRNGAAVVVDTRSGEVRAYVGSQDFFDEATGGQNDGVMAARSTGSILKPFLYALAMDEGICLPRTQIRDIPSYFGSFSPANASQTYDGLVTTKEALIRSLNVPASRLLNTYGTYKFYLFLKAAGMTTLFRQADEYGLTLILGGAEARLFDLARLYRGLGNGGRFPALRTLREIDSGTDFSSAADTVPLVSPEACYLTLEMLKEVKRPGAEYYWQQYQNQHPIAWKTGTSYGQRDAWSVGVTPEWTIAVWAGNFSGEGNPNIGGASCAAPLMFDVFNTLPKSPSRRWFRKSDLRFQKIRTCRDTGFAASPHCPDVVLADGPDTPHSLRTCPFHRTITVTLDERHAVCSLCWTPGRYKTVRRLVYSPDITQYLRESGTPVSALPPHLPGCPGRNAPHPLQILYPVREAKLWIPRDFDGTLQHVTLRVAHRSERQTVYWYLDDVYLGQTRGSHKLPIKPTRGWHDLEVVDGDGRRARRRFFVAVRSEKSR